MVYQYIVIGFFLFARGIGILPATNNLPTLRGVLFFMLAGLFFTSYNIGIKKWSVPANKLSDLILPIFLLVKSKQKDKSSMINLILDKLFLLHPNL